MKRYVFSLLLLLYSCFFFAQNSKIDSLKALLKVDKEDTTKIVHLNLVARVYILSRDYENASVYAKEALALLNEPLLIGYAKEMRMHRANTYNYLGVICKEKSDYVKALDYYMKSLHIDEEIKDKAGMSKVTGNIGNIYNRQGNYPKALDYFFKGLEIAEELGNKLWQASAYGNIGNVYRNQKDYQKALDYYTRAWKMSEELGDKKSTGLWMGNIGIVYYDQKNYTKSLEHYFKALKMKEEEGNKTEIAATLINIGSVYVNLKEYGKAIEYNFKGLKIAQENGFKEWHANALGNMGSICLKMGKYKDAYTYLYKALALSDSIGTRNELKDWYEHLSALYEKSNIAMPDTMGGKLLNMEQMRLRALYYHKRYIAVRDTLFSEENKKQLVRKEMNFEFEKKEGFAKAEQDKKDAVANADAKRQKIVLILVSFVLLLVAVVAFVVFRSLRITRKQKVLIEQQKHLVEEKQKEILDSIYYARRIQRSLLPTEKYIEKSFNKLRKSD